MNPQSRILIIVLAVHILTASARSQSPLLTNPSTLGQFPTVEQVKAGTKGADDVDSHARFMAALWRINSIIIEDLVKAPNGGTYDLPPAAESVHYRYSNAITRFSIDQPPPAARDPKYRALEDKYEKDPAFLDSLLTQFFAPKFRTDYYAWMRKPVPPSSSSGGTAPIQASADPSVAKAKAAKVDLRVFGLEIGQPVQLPVCPAGLFEQARSTCVNDPNSGFSGSKVLDSIFGIPTSSGGFDPNKLNIRLDQDHCPEWMSGCDLQAILENGRLIAVTVATSGRGVEKAVTAELKEKYGPPTGVLTVTITPDVGNAFDIHDPEWILPGLRVEYQVINQSENDIRFGWIRVMTESAYQRVLNSKKPVKRKM